VVSNEALTAGGAVSSFAVSAHGTTVVYLADQAPTTSTRSSRHPSSAVVRWSGSTMHRRRAARARPHSWVSIRHRLRRRGRRCRAWRTRHMAVIEQPFSRGSASPVRASHGAPRRCRGAQGRP
jgi:hypothetical protein